MPAEKKPSWIDRLAVKVSERRSRSRSPSSSSQLSPDSRPGFRETSKSPTPSKGPEKSPSAARTRSQTIPPQTAATPNGQTLPAQSSLWRRGYEAKKAEEPDLILGYEELLSVELGCGLADDSSSLPNLIDRELQKIEDQKWKLEIGSKSIVVREQVGRLVRAVLFAKDFITPMLSSEPHAGLAWAGICVFLPLLCRPEEQEKALLEGLDEACLVLYRFVVFERLYGEESMSKDASKQPDDVKRLRAQFEKAAVRLFGNTIELQARAACQCSRNGSVRYFRDVFKADDWAALTKSIKESDAICVQYIQTLHADEFDRRMTEISQKLDTLADAVASVVDLQKRTLEEVRTGFVKQKQHFLEAEYREILQVLWTSNYENHRRLVPERAPDTCQWFTNHERYQKFKASTEFDVLWLSADPGCGKSVIARHLVDQDLVDNDRAICYFFFRVGSPEQHTLDRALCALLNQLLVQRRMLTEHVYRAYQNKGAAFTGSVTDLWAALRQASSDSRAGEVVCVVDALDECLPSDCKDLIEFITETYVSSRTCGSNTGRLKFLVTSRPYRDLNNRFQVLLSKVPSIRLSADLETPAIAAEINLVIDYRVSEIKEANNLSESTSSAISSKLKGLNNRTYLWLQLILQVVDESLESSRGRLESMIDALPSTVYQAFGRILAQRRVGDFNSARKIFHAMLAAKRPLSVSEMSTIVALDETSCRQPELDVDPEDVFQDKMRYCCGLLIVIEDGKVFFMHQTVREFLVSRDIPADTQELLRDFKLPLTTIESNWELFLSCSQVILHEAQQRKARGTKVLLDSPAGLQGGDPSHPVFAASYHLYDPIGNADLVEYAATFWRDHARAVIHADIHQWKTKQVIHCRLCRESPKNPHLISCGHIYCLSCLEFMESQANRRGLQNAVCNECGKKYTSTEPCGDGLQPDYENDLPRKKPISDSQAHKLDSRVAELCQYNWAWWPYDPNREIQHGPVSWPATIMLAYLGFERALERYLASPEGIDSVDARDRRGRTALSWVGHTGDRSVAEVLVNHGADVNAEDVEFKRPLYYAASGAADHQLVPFLVDLGANDTKALGAAVEQSAEVAQFLLDRHFVLPSEVRECHYFLDRGMEWEDSPLYLRLARHLLTRHPGFPFTISQIGEVVLRGDADLAEQMKENTALEPTDWEEAWVRTTKAWEPLRTPHGDGDDPVYYDEHVSEWKYANAQEYFDSWGPSATRTFWDSPTTLRLVKIMNRIVNGDRKLLGLRILNGMTPLCMAGRYGNIQLFQRLLWRGAEPLAVDGSGRDALSHMADSQHTRCLDLAQCEAEKGRPIIAWSAESASYVLPGPGTTREELLRPRKGVEMMTVDDLATLPAATQGPGRMRWLANRHLLPSPM